MEMITSLQNSRIKKWTSLHTAKGRSQNGLFLVEGEHLTEEALRAGAVETIITDEECPFDFGDVIKVTPQIMKKLSQNVSAVHLIAVCRMMNPEVKQRNRLVLLDGVQDPGNLGTIIRTAVSFGFDGVYCSADTCDIYNDKAVRSSQGALFHIPVIRCSLKDLVKALRQEGVTVIATALEGAQPMSSVEVPGQAAFVFGNEGQGVSRAVLDDADLKMKIEMDGFESLNVAVAAGIVMYQYRRKQR